MDEIISSILEAEAKADGIIKDASEQAKRIIIEGNDKADKIKADAIAFLKGYRRRELKRAEEFAEKEYLKILDREKLAADKKTAALQDKADEISDNIFNRIMANGK